MAHGDALIFLTNITWIFVLFLFIYLFFVVFFLPLFYKKFRIRVLAENISKVFSVFFLRNVYVSLTLFLDFFRGLFVNVVDVLRAQVFYYLNMVSSSSLQIFSNYKVDGLGVAKPKFSNIFFKTREGVGVTVFKFLK